MEKLSYRIFICTLLFSPLAFGAVEPWSLMILEGGVLLALALFMVSRAMTRAPLVEVPGRLPLLLLLGYMVIQIVPLPAALVRLVSPSTHALYVNTIGVIEPLQWMSLSFDRHETLFELLRYTAYAGAYILSVQFFSEKKYMRHTVTAIIVFTTILALLSIIEHYTSSGRVLWFRNINDLPGFGPYVNRNHYAGFMGMVLPLMAALFLHLRPSLHYTSLRERIVEFFSHPQSHPYLLMGAAAIAVAASIFISLSRGGIVSICISLCTLGVILKVTKAGSRGGISFALLCTVILFSVGWFGWESIFDRFGDIRNYEGEIKEVRLQLWQDSLDIVRDFPLTGTGFGTFKRIYPAYRTIPEGSDFIHAHNDYLEFATDSGLVGLFLAGWFLAAVIGRGIKASLKRRDPYMIHLFWGALAGVLFILLHSVTDFNLHMGANGLFFFVLIGLMVSAAHTRQHSREKSSYLGSMRTRVSPVWAAGTGLAFVVTLAAACGNVYSRHILQPELMDIYSSPLSAEEAGETIEALEMASVAAPLSYIFPMAVGDLSAYHLEAPGNAVDCYRKALHLSPVNSCLLERLAECYENNGEADLVENLHQAAIKTAPMNADVRKQFALWLSDQARIDDAVFQMRKAIELSSEETVACLALLSEKGVTEPYLSNALPDRVCPQLAYAKHLAENGATEMAEAFFEKALQLMNNEGERQPIYFIDVYSFYVDSGKYEDALRVIRNAVSCFPNDPSIRLMAGRCYEKCDIPYRAIEEYQKVVLLDPNNVFAKKRLAAMLDAEG